VISAVLTIAANSYLKFLYENSNVSGSLLRPILKYDVYIFSYVVAFFAMYYILRKNFRHFRIGLLTHRGGEGSEILETTLLRTARVWWTYSWRSFIYGLIAAFVTAIPRGVLVGLFGRNRGLESLVAVLVSTALSGAVGLFVVYSNILDEDFGDFRVCLLPRPEPNAVPGTPAANPAVS
jgi:hypothetical protein